MNKQRIIKKIFLKPEFLGDKLNENIKNETYSQLLGKCTEELGYIVDVHDVSVIDNHIENSSSDIIFTVSVQVNVFKPVVGLVLNGDVQAIFDSGFFVNSNSHKILIPTPTKQTNLKKNDKVEIVLTAINYKNNSFCCIGSLKE